MPKVDVVTIFHRDDTEIQTRELRAQLEHHEPVAHHFIAVDNRPPNNRGFAGGCNYGAELGTSPYILFLNPDVTIEGPFMDRALNVFRRDSRIVIAGERFGKDPRHYRDHWGCRDWVCGACMFVRRDWFTASGGFDPEYVWGWEETDLIRRAQRQSKRVQSLKLPVGHVSPGVHDPDPVDAAYKATHMAAGSAIFYARYGRRGMLGR